MSSISKSLPGTITSADSSTPAILSGSENRRVATSPAWQEASDPASEDRPPALDSVRRTVSPVRADLPARAGATAPAHVSHQIVPNRVKQIAGIVEHTFSAVRFDQAVTLAVPTDKNWRKFSDTLPSLLAPLEAGTKRLRQIVASGIQQIETATRKDDIERGEDDTYDSKRFNFTLDHLQQQADEAQRCYDIFLLFSKLAGEAEKILTECKYWHTHREAGALKDGLGALKSRAEALYEDKELEHSLLQEKEKENKWMSGNERFAEALLCNLKTKVLDRIFEITNDLASSQVENFRDVIFENLPNDPASTLSREKAATLLQQHNEVRNEIDILKKSFSYYYSHLLDQHDTLPVLHSAPEFVFQRRYARFATRYFLIDSALLSLEMIDMLCCSGTRLDDLRKEANQIDDSIQSFADDLDKFLKSQDAKYIDGEGCLLEAEVMQRAASIGIALHDDFRDLIQLLEKQAKGHPFGSDLVQLINSADLDISSFNLLLEEEIAERRLIVGGYATPERKKAADEARVLIHDKYPGLLPYWTRKELKESMERKGVQREPASGAQIKSEISDRAPASQPVTLSAGEEKTWLDVAATFNSNFVKNCKKDTHNILFAAKTRANMARNTVKEEKVDDIRSEGWIDAQMSEAIGVVNRRITDLSKHHSEITKAIENAGEPKSLAPNAVKALKTLQYADKTLRESLESLMEASQTLGKVQAVLKQARLVRLFFCLDLPKDSILRPLIDAGILASATEHQGEREKDSYGWLEKDGTLIRLSKAVRRAMNEEVLPTEPEIQEIPMECHTHYKYKEGGKPRKQHFKFSVQGRDKHVDREGRPVLRFDISRRPNAFEQTLVTLRQFARTGKY